MVQVCSGDFVSMGSSHRTVLEQLLEMPGHGSPVSTIMPPEIVVPSLKLGGLREVRFKGQTCPDYIGY
jgi:hypothetical protein